MRFCPHLLSSSRCLFQFASLLQIQSTLCRSPAVLANTQFRLSVISFPASPEPRPGWSRSSPSRRPEFVSTSDSYKAWRASRQRSRSDEKQV